MLQQRHVAIIMIIMKIMVTYHGRNVFFSNCYWFILKQLHVGSFNIVLGELCMSIDKNPNIQTLAFYRGQFIEFREEWNDVKFIWNNSYIWTAVVDQSELNKLTSLPMCGFIAQLVEHRTGIRGGHGFEFRWGLDFFRLLLSNNYCLNWKIYCDDHSSLWSTTAVQIYELFHINFTSFHSSREIWTQ